MRFRLAAVVVLAVVLWTAAPASASSYIVSGIPFGDYNKAVDTDMTITVTFVNIKDPKDSSLWYTSNVDIDINAIGDILYGTSCRVTSPTPYPTPAEGFRVRTNPKPFVDWTSSISVTTPTPIPNALVLFATGLGALGFLGFLWKRKMPQDYFSAV